MPLHNHRAARTVDQWFTVHATSVLPIMARLNRRLGKKRFETKFNLHLGTRAEVDVAELEATYTDALEAMSYG